MAIFIDVLLCALFLLTVIKHTRLGLACSILSAFRLLFCLIIAGLLYSPVASLLFGAGVSAALAGTVAFLLVFLATMILSRLIIRLLSKVKIPVITKVDKFLGFFLGLVLGFVVTSLVSTSLYTFLELLSMSPGSEAMSAYTDSYVFKFIYELKIFDFIRNLF